MPQLRKAPVTGPDFRLTIAIDGTAGSGKTALGSLLANRLGYLFVDSGVFYRVLTLAALRAGIAATDGPALAALADTLDIRFEAPISDGERPDDGRLYTVRLGGEDVTWAIRGADVDAGVSPVAAQPAARAALLPLQQRLARQKGVVMAGRDIGTVVCPEAEVKVFLRADLATRARRRRQELAERGDSALPQHVADNLAERDRIDSSRDTAPLAQPPGAIVLDTAQLTLEQEAAIVLAKVEAFRNSVADK